MIDECGYQLLDASLTAEECDQLIASLESIPRSRAGARHLLSLSPIERLANDARVLGFARSVLGANAVPFRATLFDKSSTSNWSVPWHQDTAVPLTQHTPREGWGPWSVKAKIHYAHAPTEALRRVLAIRVHLDASTSENGPLRVIPRSHAHGVLTDDEVSSIAHSSEAIACLVPRGGFLAMRPLTIHSSERVLCAAPRRVVHIEFAEEWEIAPGFRLASA